MRRIDDQAVARLSIAGWTVSKIAAELGYGYSAVARARRRTGVTSGPVDRDEVTRLTLAGYSGADIATRLHCDRRTVCRIRRAVGISRPCHRTTAEELARADALLDDGASFCEVERTLGWSHGVAALHFPGRGWTREQVAEFRRRNT